MSRGGYPVYARLDDGRAYKVHDFFADNWWIVPYNPHILSQYVSFTFFLPHPQLTCMK